MNDNQLFQAVLARYAETYPHLDIKMIGSLVYINDKIAFNTDGFNLLYNLTRLCDQLKEELR